MNRMIYPATYKELGPDLDFSLSGSLNNTLRSILLDRAPKPDFPWVAYYWNHNFLGALAIQNPISTANPKLDDFNCLRHYAMRVPFAP